jgi:hypothetical protein
MENSTMVGGRWKRLRIPPLYLLLWGHAVVWLRHYAASRKVAVQFPMSSDFSVDQILPAAIDPGVFSASNRNEYQKKKKKKKKE